MLELRRMTNPDASTDRPCAWERTHLVQAAALALEAAGHRPAGAADGDDGYQVRETPQPDAVAVYAPDAATLRGCAETLEGLAGRPGSTRSRGRGGVTSWPLLAVSTAVPRSVDRATNRTGVKGTQ